MTSRAEHQVLRAQKGGGGGVRCRGWGAREGGGRGGIWGRRVLAVVFQFLNLFLDEPEVRLVVEQVLGLGTAWGPPGEISRTRWRRKSNKIIEIVSSFFKICKIYNIFHLTLLKFIRIFLILIQYTIYIDGYNVNKSYRGIINYVAT